MTFLPHSLICTKGKPPQEKQRPAAISLIIHPLVQAPHFKRRYEGQLVGQRLRHTHTNAIPLRNVNHFIINRLLHRSHHRTPFIAVQLKPKARRRRSPVIVPIVEARPNEDRVPLAGIDQVTVLLPSVEDPESAHHVRDGAGVLNRSAFAVLDPGVVICFPHDAVGVGVGPVLGTTVYANRHCNLDREN